MFIPDCQGYVTRGLGPSVIITRRRSFEKFLFVFFCSFGRSSFVTRKRLVRDHRQAIRPLRTPSLRMVSCKKFTGLTCSCLRSFARLTSYVEEPLENEKRKFA